MTLPPYAIVYVYFCRNWEGKPFKLYVGKTTRRFAERDTEHRAHDPWHMLADPRMTSITECNDEAMTRAAESEAMRDYTGLCNAQVSSNAPRGLAAQWRAEPPEERYLVRKYATGMLETVNLLDYQRHREAYSIARDHDYLDTPTDCVYAVMAKFQRLDELQIRTPNDIARKVVAKVPAADRDEHHARIMALVQTLADDDTSPVLRENVAPADCPPLIRYRLAI